MPRVRYPAIKLVIQAFEKKKKVYEHRGNNIWVNNGATYLRDLITYSSFSPLTTTEDRRIRYFGFGIGGNRQTQPSIANSPPMSVDYPGTNLQDDVTLAVSQLERPVRVSGTDWLQQLAIPDFPQIGSVHWSHQFSVADFNDGTYLSVPLSEIGLFLTDADPTADDNELVAYDTFEAISKTDVMTIKVDWTVTY